MFKLPSAFRLKPTGKLKDGTHRSFLSPSNTICDESLLSFQIVIASDCGGR